MSKRLQKFERSPRGFYPTPWEAFEPLIPHLPTWAKIAEPCAGDGALCEHLTRAGFVVSWASDIEPRHPSVQRMDARAIVPVQTPAQVDLCVTNPPWPEPRRNGEPTLSIMWNLVRNFPRSWFLLPADFMHNTYAAGIMRHCSRIVSVGRVKWIPDSDHQGFDNCAWYEFQPIASEGLLVFIPRQAKRRAA